MEGWEGGGECGGRFSILEKRNVFDNTYLQYDQHMEKEARRLDTRCFIAALTLTWAGGVVFPPDMFRTWTETYVQASYFQGGVGDRAGVR